MGHVLCGLFRREGEFGLASGFGLFCWRAVFGGLDLLIAAESADRGAVAVGAFGTDARDVQKGGDGGGGGLGEAEEDRVGEDHEGGFAGFGGLGFTPCAEAGFEDLLLGGEGGGGLFAGGAAGAPGGAGDGGGSLRVAEQEVRGGGKALLDGFAALVGQGDLLERDHLAGRVGPLFGAHRDKCGARERIEQRVEGATVLGGWGGAQGAGGEFGVQLAGGAGLAVQRAEDGGELAEVLGVGLAKALGGRGRGVAGVAMPAWTRAVGGVAKVADEGGHAAVLALGKRNHAVDLRAAECHLLVVAGAPCSRAGAAHVAGHVDLGGTLRGQLFRDPGEAFGVHAETLAEDVGHLEVVVKHLGDAGELGRWGVVALQEEVVHLAVGEGMQEDGAAGEAVAAGAADLLVVGLDGGGEGDVQDGPDVGLVDAHAEGDGGDHNLQLSREKAALDALAGGRVETRVVGGGLRAELRGKLFSGLAGWGVDDSGEVGLVLEELYNKLGAAWFGHLDDFDGEILATEAVNEERGVLQVELGNDVLLDGRCGGCGKGDDGGWSKRREVVAQGPVVGAEVVAPGADAVGLVDSDEGRLLLREHLREAGNAHALGRDEKELEGAVEVIAAGLAGVLAGQAGVDAGDLEAHGRKLAGLIVHECDEGGDDKGGAAARDGGKLVTEAFTGSGRHDEEDVAAIGGGAADGLLIGPEGGEAEGGVKQGFEVHARLGVQKLFFIWGCGGDLRSAGWLRRCPSWPCGVGGFRVACGDRPPLPKAESRAGGGFWRGRRACRFRSGHVPSRRRPASRWWTRDGSRQVCAGKGGGAGP